MRTVKIPFKTILGGVQVTAYKYKNIDDERSGHSERAMNQHHIKRKRVI